MIYTYGIELDDLKTIPTLDPRTIGPKSSPVSTRDLMRWATEGSSFVNDSLLKSGITPDENMAPETHTRCKQAVVAYVSWQAVTAMGAQAAIHDQAKAKWDNSYGELTARPQNLGASFKDNTVTNLDEPTRHDWDFKGFTKDNW
jgi:hypothetical protein